MIVRPIILPRQHSVGPYPSNTNRVEEVFEVARDEGEGARVEGVQVVAQGAVVAERVKEAEGGRGQGGVGAELGA